MQITYGVGTQRIAKGGPRTSTRGYESTSYSRVSVLKRFGWMKRLDLSGGGCPNWVDSDVIGEVLPWVLCLERCSYPNFSQVKVDDGKQ